MAGLRYEVFEVFGQREPGEPHVHAGSLLAPTPELALLLARENFCRRREYVSVWVVRRRDIAASPGPDFFAQDLDRSYRMGVGYRDTVRKWRRFRSAEGADEEATAVGR